jgi:putative ABC transport system permease protein
MDGWTLIKRSLWFHRRAHAGVALGVAVAAAAIIGALAVGDSLRQSLRQMALSRLGRVEAALVAPDRYVPRGLATDVAKGIGCESAAVLSLGGSAENQSGTARAAQIAVLGVDDAFWRIAGGGPAPLAGDEESRAVINEALAARLGARAGDTIFIRLPRQDMLPAEAAFSGSSRRGLVLSAAVKAIVSDEQGGRFSLRGGPPPLNAFVPLGWLQRKAGLAGMANVICVAGATAGSANEFLSRQAGLRLFGLQSRQIGHGGLFEIRSRRVFLDPPVTRALRGLGGEEILAYFVNDIRVGGRNTPYSIIAGIGAPPGGPEPNDDEIRLTGWLADDLGAAPGDVAELEYYALGERGELRRQDARLRVAGGEWLDANALDPSLMPDFPGLAEANECRDWDPGVPIDAGRVRPKDEQYWRLFRGTPKAVVSLAAARRMWGNRHGDLTAVRFASDSAASAEAAADSCLKNISPAAVGLVFRPVRSEAMEAARKSMDFGWLMAGMSVFLIFSALLLTALLSGLSVRRRLAEIGTLLAMGFTPGHARRLLLGECLILAAGGVAGGAALAVAYGAAALAVLRGLLPAGTGAADLRFHISAGAIGQGAAMSLALALAAMWIVLRRQMKGEVRELLAADGSRAGGRLSAGRGGRLVGAAGAAMAAGAISLAAAAGRLPGRGAAMIFFSAGALLLAAGVAVSCSILCRLAARPSVKSLRLLGVSNAARRMGRSLAVATTLACGTFIVVGVGANWKSPAADPWDRASGTGGFALFATSAAPLPGDLFALGGRARSAETAPSTAASHDGAPPEATNDVVPIRVRSGDEASCLNLNHPAQPAVWGVDPSLLSRRRRFTFSAFATGVSDDGWGALAAPDAAGDVPAVADSATLEWALGAGVGDIVVIQDEEGRPVRVRVVASLAPSILQGGILISERQFVRLFPSAGGYRMFLIDASPAQLSAAQADLASSRVLQDAGLDVASSGERLARFDAVENAYLSMFQVLGGLGVLLGTAGLGLLVFRNVMERRGELAIMRAAGFSRGQVRRVVLWEHWLLVAMGLGAGAAAGLLAVMPALGAGAAAHFPWLTLAATVLLIAASALAWTWCAAGLALRGSIVAALRNE